MTATIQQLKENIAILQIKLQKLEEAEKEPDMMLMRQGKVDIVDYDTKVYYRIEYTDSFSGAYVWFLRRRGEENIRQVRDVNVYGVLEDYYQKQVLKQKEDYPYKKQHPEEVAEGLRDAMRQAKKDGVFDAVDEPPEYDEVEWDISENVPSKPAVSLYARLDDKFLYSRSGICKKVRGFLLDEGVIEYEDDECITFTLHKSLLDAPND